MYVIYNIKTFKKINTRFYSSTFKTEGAAKGTLTRAIASGRAVEGEYKIDTEANYATAEPMVETRNILNPEAGPIMIRASQLGGCCDPGTESYHSM